MTVDKSLGMTVDAAEIHCNDMWFPGLLPAAISRVSNKENLRVVKFSKRIVLPPNPAVKQSI